VTRGGAVKADGVTQVPGSGGGGASSGDVSPGAETLVAPICLRGRRGVLRGGRRGGDGNDAQRQPLKRSFIYLRANVGAAEVISRPYDFFFQNSKSK